MKELYPPILPFYIPAFDYTKKAIIPFKLSIYNSIEQVKKAQLVIKYQTSNQSALKPSFLNEIVEVNIGTNEELSEYPYCIEIDGAQLLKNGFEVGTIYKLQIRLSEVDLTNSAIGSPTAAQLSQNLEKFSEWSTVCLLKPIQVPDIYISEFTSTSSSASATKSVYSFSAGDAVFNWGYEGYNGETIYKYRLKLYQDNTLIGDSGSVAVNTYNIAGSSASGYYDFEQQLEPDLTFTLVYEIETKNGFISSIEYVFNTVQALKSDFDPTIEVTVNEEEAFANVSIKSEDKINIILTLRRSSSKDNFSKWVDITNLTIKNTYVDLTYQDFTIESGVVYQYGIQVRDNNRRRSSLIKSNYASGIFEHTYLLAHNGGLTSAAKQLKLKFNTAIASFATTVLESKMETIGGKYPYITRNGNTYYRVFSLSGLISHFMDDMQLFTSRKEIYSEAEDPINAMNEARRHGSSRMLHNLNDNDKPEGYTGSSAYQYDDMYDYTYERDFRERVMDFFYEDKVRLFKSATEGNILVRLMDVTFTPRQELNRLVYDFSATAVEIAEPTIENLRRYNIHEMNPYEADLSYSEEILGQLSSFGYKFYAGININEAIQRRHHIGEVVNKIHIVSGVIKYLRIEFESDPYLINKSTMTPVTYATGKDAAMGWIINYGTTPILVTWPNNVYEFKDPNLSISSTTSITFPKEVKATIDYIITLVEEPQGASQIVQELEYEYKIGQLFDVFQPMENFIDNIKYKYTINNSNYSQKVNHIRSLEIEAEPNSVLYVRQEKEAQARRFVMNFSGVLRLEPDNSTISFVSAYFYGTNITAAQLHTNLGQVTTLPATAAEYDYCTVANNQYIYFRGKWCELKYIADDNSYDISCPRDGIINYYIQTVRKIYS